MQTSKVWYLGIDLGTTGLSAVLFNFGTRDLHPIYWKTVNERGSTEYSAQNPSTAYSGMIPGSDVGQLPAPSIAVGFLASSLAGDRSGVFIQKLKPYLKMGIPYHSPRANNWEPVLQWSSQQPVTLYWLRRALETLLVTLKPSLDPAISASGSVSLPVSAAGLDAKTFQAALLTLNGVIMGSPAFWGDTYRFNLREAVLGSGLVKHPEQIFFIEDAIATVLAELSDFRLDSTGEHPEFSKTAQQPDHPKSQIPNPNLNNLKSFGSAARQQRGSSGANAIKNQKLNSGSTVVVNAGATTTELAVVDLPHDLQDLSHSDFMLRSFPYGGSYLDQDIICQMFLRQGDGEQQAGAVSQPLLAHLCSIDTDFKLPLPSEPALAARYRLQQQLHNTPLGVALLEAAQKIKQILQHQDEFILELGPQKCVCTAKDLDNRVVLPFVQRLNQELNTLLSQTKLAGQEICQVICAGRTSALGRVRKWLQQKFPNATFIYEIGKMKSAIHPSSSILLSSKVACGLATLPLYPQVLARQEHQYSDYFLLLELCRTVPDKSLSVQEIMQLMENRGINTRACHQRLIDILAGHLPTNLVPSYPDACWLTEASRQNLDYQGIAAAPLFYQEGNQYYRLNPQQCQRLMRYLDTVLSGTYQKLEEPMIVDLG